MPDARTKTEGQRAGPVLGDTEVTSEGQDAGPVCGPICSRYPRRVPGIYAAKIQEHRGTGICDMPPSLSNQFVDEQSDDVVAIEIVDREADVLAFQISGSDDDGEDDDDDDGAPERAPADDREQV